ncbi:hypothetical protein [Deinococcus sp. AJ005]|uniref:hypothetical protein n=1 Tax=Deinococcus sp. AJ005 TaxID=2652443 RepID=UPI00125CC283|nr:hypothetical protein [Deinococcus sp. AJ005]QFP76458.1 hypothetical protein DAAJ005_08325 [Deinococcus sp. AJ005]
MPDTVRKSIILELFSEAGVDLREDRQGADELVPQYGFHLERGRKRDWADAHSPRPEPVFPRSLSGPEQRPRLGQLREWTPERLACSDLWHFQSEFVLPAELCRDALDPVKAE